MLGKLPPSFDAFKDTIYFRQPLPFFEEVLSYLNDKCVMRGKCKADSAFVAQDKGKNKGGRGGNNNNNNKGKSDQGTGKEDSEESKATKVSSVIFVAAKAIRRIVAMLAEIVLERPKQSTKPKRLVQILSKTPTKIQTRTKARKRSKTRVMPRLHIWQLQILPIPCPWIQSS